MNGSQDTTQKRKTAERRTQRRGYFLPGDSMKSELEEVRDLRGSSVFSSRKLESSKLDPRLESEQEMHRDLRLAEKNI